MPFHELVRDVVPTGGSVAADNINQSVHSNLGWTCNTCGNSRGRETGKSSTSLVHTPPLTKMFLPHLRVTFRQTPLPRDMPVPPASPKLSVATSVPRSPSESRHRDTAVKLARFILERPCIRENDRRQGDVRRCRRKLNYQASGGQDHSLHPTTETSSPKPEAGSELMFDCLEN